MKLYVMRHGHSPSVAESGAASDAERPLSEKGRGAARAQARALKDAGAKLSIILHSPMRRAVETAAEAAAVLGVPAKILPALANVVGPEELARALAGPLQAGEVLAVGHQPQVGELCVWLCGRTIPFEPAGVAALELETLGPQSARVLFARSPAA